jgi:uncharacterized RDD family membrane protein YckC
VNAPLAPVIRRIVAYLIDCLIVFGVFVLLLQFALFIPIRSTLFDSAEWWRSGWRTEIYTLLTISLPAWLYFILMEISPWRATLGKRIFGLQAVSALSKDRLSFGQSVLRTLIKLLPWELAHLTNNLPTPMWYTNIQAFVLALPYPAAHHWLSSGHLAHSFVAGTA